MNLDKVFFEVRKEIIKTENVTKLKGNIIFTNPEIIRIKAKNKAPTIPSKPENILLEL